MMTHVKVCVTSLVAAWRDVYALHDYMSATNSAYKVLLEYFAGHYGDESVDLITPGSAALRAFLEWNPSDCDLVQVAESSTTVSVADLESVCGPITPETVGAGVSASMNGRTLHADATFTSSDS